jgi:hypothetical protein
MKRPHYLVKVAVVLNSILLVGGCVGYQSGAFNWLSGSAAPSTESTAKPAPNESEPEAASPAKQIFISGSKSKFTPVIDLSGAEPAQTPATPKQPPTDFIPETPTASPPINPQPMPPTK